jgi:hypothetical protein
MEICAISCREMLPDPAFFAECLRASFTALKEAAERRASEDAPEATRPSAKQAKPAKASAPKAPRKRPRRVLPAKYPVRKFGRRRKAAPAAAAKE